MMYLSKQYLFGGGLLGLNALTIANSKSSLGFVQAVVLGIFCNALVCLAVWLCMSARSATDRVFLIIPPIAAFVAAGLSTASLTCTSSRSLVHQGRRDP